MIHKLKLLIIILFLLTFSLILCELALRATYQFITNYDIEMWKYAKKLKIKSQNANINHTHINNKSAKLQKVEIKTLDSFKLKNINFIKIDVQNYELEVLRGAVETLKNNDPIVCLEELKVNLKDSDEIILLQSLNYSVVDRIGKEVILKKLN